MKNTIIGLVVIIILAVGGYFLYQYIQGQQGVPQEPSGENPDGETPEPVAEESETVIGTSAGGRPVTAFHYGSGEKELLLVGGIHGGYSWNTALLGFELMDYLEGKEGEIPEGVKVTVIPVLNPDGLNAVVGTPGRFAAADVPASEAATIPGRFNGNDVDLNRNFDCDWKAEGTWQTRTVSGGTEAFSEPESAAIRSYIEANEPDAVVVYYSSVGGVFASNCHEGVLAETSTILEAYADASGYSAHETFDYYAITGDMTNWLAKEGIPAISVLLTNHTSTESAKNEAGVDALIAHLAGAE